MAVELDFVKGHGTENDFVLVSDVDAQMAGLVDGRVPPTLVRSLCDRRTGIGGDGLLRVVRADLHPDSSANLGRPAPDGDVVWFMDYYNADGSTGEMCGNGLRVFARYLAAADLIDGYGRFGVDTRAGVRQVMVESSGRITVGMGPVTLGTRDITVATAEEPDELLPAVQADVGNPHLVVEVDDLDRAGRLLVAPVFDPAEAMPDGANVEFVRRLGDDHLELRVFERGVGETRSCGTGACAAAVVMRGAGAGAASVRVDVPGGSLQVGIDDDDQVTLGGDAELTFMGRIAIQATG